VLWDHDVRLSKATGDHAKVLNFRVSAFNVLNHANYTSYVGTVSSPLFRQPVAAMAGRQMQFGLRYQF
jgi:hypothetical protein